jgi:hypothetical protein
VIVSGGDMTQTADAGDCGANVVVALPTVSDNCGIQNVVNGYTHTSNASGHYPVGTTVVNWIVLDIHGNISTTSQTIVVTDNENPVITAPADISVNNDAGNCSAVVSLGSPVTGDNCGVATVVNDHSSNVYPVGTTVVTWTVTDIHGNSSTAAQTVVVTDNENPVITAPDITVNNNQGNCGANVTVPSPVTGDNCGVASVSNSYNNSTNVSGYYPTGTTNVSWTVTDIHGNSTTIVQHITVVDNEAPIVTTQNITIQLSASGVAGISAAQINNGSTDNCGIASYSLSKTSFDCSNVGANTVTLMVTDIYGNSSSATAVVTVQDLTAPVVVTQNITVQLDGTGNVSITAAQVNNGSSDACGIASMSVTPNSFNCSNLGANTVTLTVTDVNGNSSTATAVVTVQDKLGPVPTITTLPTITGQCSATVLTKVYFGWNWWGGCDDDDDDEGDHDWYYYSLVAPTALDNCSGLIKGKTTDALTYNTQGDHVIHWTYTDANGNTTVQEQHVIVNDTKAPVPQHRTLPVITAQCSVTIGASPSNRDGRQDEDHDDNGNQGNTAPWARDNCSGWIRGTTPVTTFSTQGSYTIVWTYTDGHGNSSTQNQTVIVKDNTAPKVTVSKLPTITAQCSATVTTVPTAMDNCSGLISGSTSSPLSYNTQGTYTINWVYNDGNGNSSSQTQTVIVKDNVSPVVKTRPLTVTLVNGVATINASQVDNGSTDNCAIATKTVSKTTFNCSNVGSNTVVLTVTDVNGNSSSANAVVTVLGSPASVNIVSVPTNNTYTGGVSTNLYLGYGAQSTTLQTSAGSGVYTYSWSGAKASQLSSTTGASPVFTPTTSGTASFVVTATNSYGCITTDDISICVTDIRVPGTSGSTAKVYMCHTVAGKKGYSQTMQVLVSQVPSHLGSGQTCGSNGNDRLGSCDQTPCNGSGASVSSVITSNTESNSTKELGSSDIVTTEEELKVTVMPNPSTTFFTLKFESRYETPVNLRVMDGTGRLIDARSKIGANSTIQIGHNYSSGTYYAEMIQGNKRKVVQLIKGRG